MPAPNWAVFVPSADNEQNRWRQTTTLFGQGRATISDSTNYWMRQLCGSGANGQKYTQHGALIQNLNPTYTQNTDRDLLRTVPGIAPVISRSLNSPIFHLNTSHLAQPLAQPLIAARSSGYFLTRPLWAGQQHRRKVIAVTNYFASNGIEYTRLFWQSAKHFNWHDGTTRQQLCGRIFEAERRRMGSIFSSNLTLRSEVLDSLLNDLA